MLIETDVSSGARGHDRHARSQSAAQDTPLTPASSAGAESTSPWRSPDQPALVYNERFWKYGPIGLALTVVVAWAWSGELVIPLLLLVVPVTSLLLMLPMVGVREEAQTLASPASTRCGGRWAQVIRN